MDNEKIAIHPQAAPQAAPRVTAQAAWLRFSLAFDASARYCQHIRQAQPDVAAIKNLVADYLLGEKNGLIDALSGVVDTNALKAMVSEHVTQQVKLTQQWVAKHPSHALIGLDSAEYPTLLSDTTHAPVMLYAKGDLAALNQPALAIVGSRKASRLSIDLTFQLAAAMARRGVTIVSGLARGIDAAAHKGALSVGGRTIAVAATSADIVYPRQHQALEAQIIDSGGLVLTEYALGSRTQRWYFPRRNRIISGLSLGVLVAEAALPSGTLTTATHAINQGREVMAVPGNVQNPQVRGCHALIKQGATLVESEQDILDALAWPLLRSIEQQQHAQDRSDQTIKNTVLPKASALETRILRALHEAPATVEDLMAYTDASFTDLSRHLGMLEIDGKITASAGGRYTAKISNYDIVNVNNSGKVTPPR